MKLKAPGTSFVILTFPLFVCGQVSIQESGSLTDHKSYILDCTISPFTGTATWAKDGAILTTCTSTICDTPSSGVSTFSTSSSGIQVQMNPVSISVDGLWKCTSSAGPFDERNVTSTRSSVDTECGWCVFDCDDETWCIVLIVFGLPFGIQIIIIIILIVCGIDWDVACVLVCWIWCCIICCCKKNYERDPESYNTDRLHQELNNTDRLHYRCCTRGGQFYRQYLTCLNFDGRVFSNESTNEQPHTGRNMQEKRPLPPIGDRMKDIEINTLSQ